MPHTQDQHQHHRKMSNHTCSSSHFFACRLICIRFIPIRIPILILILILIPCCCSGVSSYKCSALSGVNIKEACSQLVNRIAENNVAELKQAESEKGESASCAGRAAHTSDREARYGPDMNMAITIEKWATYIYRQPTMRCDVGCHVCDISCVDVRCYILCVDDTQKKKLNHNNVNNHDRSRKPMCWDAWHEVHWMHVSFVRMLGAMVMFA